MMRKLLPIAILLAPGMLLAQTPVTTRKAPTSHTTTHHAAPATATHTVAEPKAIFETTAGKITCTLFKDKAPITVANFIGLATGKKEWTNPVTGVKKVNTPMYDGTIFHRVIPNFMIQGGDPAGNGSGEIGFTIPDEFRPDLKFDIPGRLAMANTGRPHTGAGQFFITVAPTPWLNGKHTIFGQCEPPTVIDKIVNQPRDPSNDKPFNPIRITHVQIVQAGATAPAHKSTAPAHKAAPAHKPVPKK
jgi:peptidyl-prolyl cis-trans isomerase A (cyclophilin A)